MNKKQYSKDSVVGKIYKWVVGGYPDTNSCDVRKQVLIVAPLKLLFGGWRLPAYLVFIDLALLRYPFYNPLWGDHGAVFVVAAYIVTGAAIIGALFAAFDAIWDFLFGKIHLVSPETKMRTRKIVRDWWDDIYNKVCKPVEWK